MLERPATTRRTIKNSLLEEEDRFDKLLHRNCHQGSATDDGRVWFPTGSNSFEKECEVVPDEESKEDLSAGELEALFGEGSEYAEHWDRAAASTKDFSDGSSSTSFLEGTARAAEEEAVLLQSSSNRAMSRFSEESRATEDPDDSFSAFPEYDAGVATDPGWTPLGMRGGRPPGAARPPTSDEDPPGIKAAVRSSWSGARRGPSKAAPMRSFVISPAGEMKIHSLLEEEDRAISLQNNTLLEPPRRHGRHRNTGLLELEERDRYSGGDRTGEDAAALLPLVPISEEAIFDGMIEITGSTIYHPPPFRRNSSSHYGVHTAADSLISHDYGSYFYVGCYKGGSYLSKHDDTREAKFVKQVTTFKACAEDCRVAKPSTKSEADG